MDERQTARQLRCVGADDVDHAGLLHRLVDRLFLCLLPGLQLGLGHLQLSDLRGHALAEAGSYDGSPQTRSRMPGNMTVELRLRVNN